MDPQRDLRIYKTVTNKNVREPQVREKPILSRVESQEQGKTCPISPKPIALLLIQC